MDFALISTLKEKDLCCSYHFYTPCVPVHILHETPFFSIIDEVYTSFILKSAFASHELCYSMSLLFSRAFCYMFFFLCFCLLLFSRIFLRRSQPCGGHHESFSCYAIVLTEQSLTEKKERVNVLLDYQVGMASFGSTTSIV